jgi:methionine synthase I (cobalamin-dependent)
MHMIPFPEKRAQKRVIGHFHRKEVLITGSIRPVELLGYPNETLQTEPLQLIREVVQEQARALEGRGVDLFILETFSPLAGLSASIDAMRSRWSLSIIAQMTFPRMPIPYWAVAAL